MTTTITPNESKTMKIKKVGKKEFVNRNGLFGDLSSHTASYKVFQDDEEVGFACKNRHHSWEVYLIDHSNGKPQLRPFINASSLTDAKQRIADKTYNSTWRAV